MRIYTWFTANILVSFGAIRFFFGDINQYTKTSHKVRTATVIK